MTWTLSAVLRGIGAGIGIFGFLLMCQISRAQSALDYAQPNEDWYVLVFGQSNASGYMNLGQLYNPNLGDVEAWAKKPSAGWVGHPYWSQDTSIAYPRPMNGLGANFDNTSMTFNNNTTTSKPFQSCIDLNQSGGGLEVSLVKLLEQEYPGVSIAVGKFAVGGTSIEGEWNPNGPTQYQDNYCYRGALNVIAMCKSRSAWYGRVARFALIAWNQGEAGAGNVYPFATHTSQYKALTEQLFANLRAVTEPDVPIVMARMGNQMEAAAIVNSYATAGANPNVATRQTVAHVIAAEEQRRADQIAIGSEVTGVAVVNCDNYQVLQQGAAQYWMHFVEYLWVGEHYFDGWEAITHHQAVSPTGKQVENACLLNGAFVLNRPLPLPVQSALSHRLYR